MELRPLDTLRKKFQSISDFGELDGVTAAPAFFSLTFAVSLPFQIPLCSATLDPSSRSPATTYPELSLLSRNSITHLASRRPKLPGCYPSLCALLLLLSIGCSRDRPPDGQIMIKNDSQDRSYNVITVSGGGAYGSLRPGEKMTLPAGTKSFSVERRYKDYTRSYSVSCPPLGRAGILVKLIDIHVNRIAGGCKTTHASKE